MYADDDQLDKQLRSTMFSLSGTGFFGAIGRSINLGKLNFVVHIYLFFLGESLYLKDTLNST